ncbi:MAG: ribonuclease R [Gammaproteobacteria bacterium]|nr:MAG: ribonuclease R [Gammaproteobacteria bacterium]
MLKKDPQLKREQQNYKNPVASREFITEVIKNQQTPLSFNRLIREFKYKDESQIEGLRRRLIAMSRDGQIFKNRKGGFLIVENNDFISGIVQAHSEGFGFLIPDEGDRDDLVLYNRQMQTLMNNDRIIARVGNKDRKGRDEAILVRVVERAYTKIAGTFFNQRGLCYVQPDNKRLYSDIFIPPVDINNAKDGQIVEAKITEYATSHHNAVGVITKILGDEATTDSQTEVALLNFNIPADFSDEAMAEIKKIPQKINNKDFKNRNDLRDLTFVTIDGADSKDFDDAVYCEKNKNNEWVLYVAIADVASYVKHGSKIDEDAADRATSVYLPHKVIPMLPEILSNNLCSLMPQVDRLALCCQMTINNDGTLKNYDFYNAVIHSKARLTYDEVYEFLITKKDPEIQNKHKNIKKDLTNLLDLYKILRKQRDERGALEFDSSEGVIEFNEHDKSIKNISPAVQHDIHRLIEECMIMANVSCALFLKKNKLSGLYRVHDKPTAEKIKNLRDFLKLYGLDLKGTETPDPKHFLELYKQFKGRDNSFVLSLIMLRSLKQAYYNHKSRPHFGLALNDYAHFTSPIRRYPDLLNHRLIKEFIATKKSDKIPNITQIATLCSQRQRRADEIVYDIQDWLKCQYMQDKINQSFDGIINTVTSFGLFVKIGSLLVEGMIHITNLPKDFYHFDVKNHKLIGQHTGKIYKLGDKVKIVVNSINLNERKIEFLISS